MQVTWDNSPYILSTSVKCEPNYAKKNKEENEDNICQNWLKLLSVYIVYWETYPYQIKKTIDYKLLFHRKFYYKLVHIKSELIEKYNLSCGQTCHLNCF